MQVEKPPRSAPGAVLITCNSPRDPLPITNNESPKPEDQQILLAPQLPELRPSISPSTDPLSSLADNLQRMTKEHKHQHKTQWQGVGFGSSECFRILQQMRQTRSAPCSGPARGHPASAPARPSPCWSLVPNPVPAPRPRSRSQSLQVDIAYAPFIERFEIAFGVIRNYDIKAGRPKLAKWIEEVLSSQGPRGSAICDIDDQAHQH